MDKGKGKLIENDDRNNIPGSHNRLPILQQQTFGAGGDRTVVQKQQRVAQPSLTPLALADSKKKTGWRDFSSKLVDGIMRRHPKTAELPNRVVRATKELLGSNSE
ncbi:hypothetical protein Dsin_031894 [Dipteronia sinensis]|uniref:Uncharacterized protein n=1 Tax=Dipteronia sinensis TaxID=43782 RepID=A0AAE0DSN1_9ROSI|nr:hypothetical protein Dsin_031894 [Dipteronia sinensis]